MATIPSPQTALAVACEQMLSAITLCTPPWTMPQGCSTASVTSTWARTSSGPLSS